MTIYGSTHYQNLNNVFYPDKHIIKTADELAAVACFDHVGAAYTDNHRGKNSFVCSDVLLLDIDNGSKEGPEVLPKDWKTAAEVQAAFPGVEFYTVDSRNHQKEKGATSGDHHFNLSARPRQHYYFPLKHPITDMKKYADLKAQAQALFPAFDPDALDAARFLHGVKQAHAEYFPGRLCIDEYLADHAPQTTIDAQTAEEAPTASTLPTAGGKSAALDYDSVIGDGDEIEWADFYAEIKRRIPCSDFLTPSPKAGPNMFNCPFCRSGTGPNNTGALKVYPDNTFVCHKCRRGGDVINLYRDLHSLPDNWTAAKELADTYHIDRPGRQNTPAQAIERPGKRLERDTSDFKDKGEELPAERENATAGEIRANIANWTDDISRGLDLVRKLRLSEDLAQAFELGYAGALYFDDLKAEAPALVIPYAGQPYYYAISGTHTQTPGGQKPVYNALALQAGKPCFVCENPLDALAIIQAGGNACAAGGLNETIQAIRQGNAALLVCNPSDELKDALDKADPKINYKAVNIDPAQMLRNDPAALEKIISDVYEAPEDILDDFLKTIFTRKYAPISTGLPGLDEMLNGGLIPETLTIIGAAPGAGKTVLATQIMESMARQGRPCLYVNLEMSRDQLLARSLARICKQRLQYSIAATAILQGYKLEPLEKEKLAQAVDIYKAELAQTMSYADGPASVSALLDALTQAAKAAQAIRKPAPNICIDYLQITQGNPREDTKDTIQRLLLGLKNYARKTGALVIAITAQNRQANKTNTPSMDAGRDTSALEYSADVSLQLNADIGGSCRLAVVKNRFGIADMENELGLMLKGGVLMTEWTESDNHINA